MKSLVKIRALKQKKNIAPIEEAMCKVREAFQTLRTVAIEGPDQIHAIQGTIDIATAACREIEAYCFDMPYRDKDGCWNFYPMYRCLPNFWGRIEQKDMPGSDKKRHERALNSHRKELFGLVLNIARNRDFFPTLHTSLPEILSGDSKGWPGSCLRKHLPLRKYFSGKKQSSPKTFFHEQVIVFFDAVIANRRDSDGVFIVHKDVRSHLAVGPNRTNAGAWARSLVKWILDLYPFPSEAELDAINSDPKGWDISRCDNTIGLILYLTAEHNQRTYPLIKNPAAILEAMARGYFKPLLKGLRTD